MHQGGQASQRGTAWRTVDTLRKGHTVVVGVGNEKEKNLTNGRIAFYEHGGKTGRAMIKYPLCKKNAQHPKHCVYRSGCVLSISVID